MIFDDENWWRPMQCNALCSQTENAVLNRAPHAMRDRSFMQLSFSDDRPFLVMHCLHGKNFIPNNFSLSLWDIRKHLVREPCDKGFNSFSHFITLFTQEWRRFSSASLQSLSLLLLQFMFSSATKYGIFHMQLTVHNASSFCPFYPSCFPSPESESFCFVFFFSLTICFLCF